MSLFEGRSQQLFNSTRVVLLVALLHLQAAIPAVAQDTSSSLVDRMEARVVERPDDAPSWRMLGRAREQSGNLQGALAAFARSVELDPHSSAAHFDLARLSQSTGDAQAAANHFAEVDRLAPGSEYGQQAREFLVELPQPEGTIVLAEFEIRRFDRSDLVPGNRTPAERLERSPLQIEDLPPPLSLRLETGALFNTNVALAPTSRELAAGTRASWQAFAAPELEYAVWNTADWRVGPTFRGYFNLNEDEFQSFNLQSYQPGVFIERLLILDGPILIPRLAYTFTHDALEGQTFADRQAVTIANTVVWPSLNESNLYWVSDITNYADDGLNQHVTSRDGWTNTLGASHRQYFNSRWLQSASGGIEAQRADTQGVNFTYNSLGLFGDVEIPVYERLLLLVNGGLAFRHYPDAQLDPSRDEFVSHAGARLQWDITQSWAAALVFNYDRFDSQNEMFSSDRKMFGVTMTFRFP